MHDGVLDLCAAQLPGKVDVEAVLETAPPQLYGVVFEGPRFDLGQVDVAQGEGRQRVEELPWLLREGEHHRDLLLGLRFRQPFHGVPASIHFCSENTVYVSNCVGSLKMIRMSTRVVKRSSRSMEKEKFGPLAAAVCILYTNKKPRNASKELNHLVLCLTANKAFIQFLLLLRISENCYKPPQDAATHNLPLTTMSMGNC